MIWVLRYDCVKVRDVTHMNGVEYNMFDAIVWVCCSMNSIGVLSCKCVEVRHGTHMNESGGVQNVSRNNNGCVGYGCFEV